MKKNIKFFSVLFLFALAGSILVSCGGQKGEVVLEWPCIWVGQDSKAPVVRQLVDQFNQNNAGKIRVVIEEQPDYDAYEDRLRAQIAAGRAPDIFTYKLTPTTAAFYEGDILMDFSSELNRGWKNVFISSNLDDCTIDGKIKSLPYEVALTPIWYNKALLDKAGVSEFPKTFNEFWDAAEKLKEAGIVPASQMTGGSNAWTSMLWYTHIVASIGGPDILNRPFDDPAYVQAAEIMLKMFQDGNTTRDAVGGDAGVSGGHFLAQRTALFINGPWYIGRVRNDAPEVYENTVITHAPAVEGGKSGAQVGFMLNNFGAASQTDKAKRDAVISFLNWMTRPENVKQISLASGSLFAIRFDIDAGDELDPLQRQFIEAANNATFTVKNLETAMNSEAMTEFGQQLGRMALGESTPEEFVAAVKARLN